MADDDLTPTEKKSAVVVGLLTPAILAGLFFLFSWMAHSTVPAPKPADAKKGHVTKAAPAAKKTGSPFDVQSPLYWIAFAFTLGFSHIPPEFAAAVGAVIGILYGLEAALLASYDLSKPGHWLAWITDLSWSLPNTLVGLFLFNSWYFIAGSPNRGQSRGKAWISFKGSLGPVLQTVGPINIGGEGCHEPVHLLQARLFGPTFVPLQVANYVLNGILQILWTGTLGLILKLTGVRDSAWFRPNRDSAVKSADKNKSGVGDFFGWIYRYTLMEIWGYGVQPAGCGATDPPDSTT